MKKLVFGRYDYAAFSTFLMYSFCSIVIPMCLIPLAISLGFPLEDGGMALGGALQLGRAIPMVVAMVFCGFASGIWGKRRTLGYSILLMAVGIMLASIAPGYGILFLALVISGLGEGVIEGLTTPFVQDIHPDEPGRYLNLSHSFWSLGVVTLTLTAGALLYAGVSWRYIVFAVGLLAMIPTLLYLWPDKKTSYPDHQDKMHWKEVIQKTREILKVKRFWLFFGAMFFAGGAEFCLTFWCASFIQIEYGGAAWAAGAGTAMFAAGMFVGRIASGYLVRQNGLKLMLLILTAAGIVVSLFFPFLCSLSILFVLLFISGITMGPLWPSIQSDGDRRVRRDSTMVMILFSCAGVPGCGFFATMIGVAGDAVGLRMSFFIVPISMMLVLILLGWDWLAERKEKKNPSSSPSVRLAASAYAE